MAKKATAKKSKGKARPGKPAKRKPVKAAKAKAAKAKAAKGKAAKAAKPTRTAKTKAKAKPKAAARRPAAPPPPDPGAIVAELSGRAMIVRILGDAEAYFFDFARLGPDKRAELIEHHLAGFDRRKRGEGRFDWAESFVPVALIGESMPPTVRSQFDLSAPHEGVLVFHRGTGALLHASSKDDTQLAVLAPDLGTLAPTPTYLDEVFDPGEQSYAYEVDRSASRGFTLGQIELLMHSGGAQLTLV